LTGAPAEDRAAEREKKRRRERAERRAASRRRAATGLRVARALVRRLPMPVACAIGHALGTIAFWIGGRARRQAEEHLASGLPELSAAERRRIARRSFALLGRGACAFMVAHRQGAERTLRRLTFQNVEVPRDALANSSKGALLVTFHFGAFEIFASWIGRELGARAVGRESDEDGPTALLIEMRREMGCETIQRGEPREILRTLRDGRPVAFLIDQDVAGVNGVFVPFFGRLAHTPLGPAALAVRTGAPILMGFIAWDGFTRHRAWALPPLTPRGDLPPDEAALELTARMTRLGEEEIRKRPDHWVWMHRRWETRPEDHPDHPVYPRANP
jgi:KDO2-lipid IV(A) lauroyltransferase